MIFIASLIVLIASGFADFITGRMAGKFGAIEKNPFGEIIGCFGNVIIMGGLMSAVYFAMAPYWFLSLPCFAFAGWHSWAAWHNYKLYKRLKGAK